MASIKRNPIPTAPDAFVTTDKRIEVIDANTGDVMFATIAQVGSGAVPASSFSVVNHGATAGTARTGAAPIRWIGSVAPTNATNNDEWYNTSTTALSERVAGAWVVAGSSQFAPVSQQWTAATAYVVGQLVHNAGILYRVSTAHTSPGSFATTNLTTISAAATDTTIYLDSPLYGAAANGSTADNAAILLAIAAAQATGRRCVIDGNGKTYAFSAGLFTGASNMSGITFRSMTFKKVSTAVDSWMMYTVPRLLTGVTFDTVTFDGNGLGAWSCISWYSPEFIRCTFHGAAGALALYTAWKSRFHHCLFSGVRSGVMASGTWTQTPVPAAVYGQGLSISLMSLDAEVDDCDFHFCRDGFAATASDVEGNTSVEGLTRVKNRFRGDWWCQPYVTANFVPTSFTDDGSGNLVIHVSGGGLTGKFVTSAIIAIPIAVGSGAAFSSCYLGKVITTTSMGTCKKGDVIETADGKRAEIDTIMSTTTVYVRRWESMDTFHETDPPTTMATAWRVRRYYSAMVYLPTANTDTAIGLYHEPINPHTGERLVTESAATMVGVTCQVFPVMNYSGSQVTHGHKVRMSGEYFRGSWADQCSNFDSDQVTITDQDIDLGWDEGVTATRVLNLLMDNIRYRHCGTSAAFVASRAARITNQSVSGGWAQTNRAVKAAFELRLGVHDGSYPYYVDGLVATRDSGAQGGSAEYLVSLHSSQSDDNYNGTIINGLQAPGARTGDIYINDDILQAVTVRGSFVAGGANAAYAVSWVPTTPIVAGGTAIENVGAIESNVNVVAATGATETLDTSVYGWHICTMDQNCTFTFSNPAPTGKGSMFTLELRGAFTPTWPASVKWPDGSQPTYTTPSLYTFATRDGGTTWFGAQAGKAFA